MRGFQRDNLLFSLCGLNCALCKMQLGGHCPGCGGGEGNQSCAIARCGMAHGVAYCFQCADYPCARYAEGDTADSFVIRRTRGQDVALARAAGVEAYTEALDLVEDKAGEVWDQEIEGKTGYEWVHDKALQAVKNYAAVEEKFEELGYTLAEEQEAYAENQATQRYNYYSGLYEANGISSDSVVAIYMNQMKSSVIFQNTYAPGGTQGLSVDELKQELEENYLRFKTIMLPRTNSDGVLLSDEELAAAEGLYRRMWQAQAKYYR